MRTFRNPSNGHEETVDGISILWTVLFGGFYLLFKGLWGHFLIWLLLCITAAAADPVLLVLVVPALTIGYAIGILPILAGRYLSRGWVESGNNQPYRSSKAAKLVGGVRVDDPAMEGATKKCPFCAEEILAEAKLCKHCKSPLPG